MSERGETEGNDRERTDEGAGGEESSEAPPERRSVRERRRHGGPSPEETETPEDGSKVDPDTKLGQVDKRDRIPGRERGERPLDTGTYTDKGSRGN